MSNSEQCIVQVNLRIFDPAVVQSAAYNLLATYEFDLQPPNGHFMSVAIWPVGGKGALPPDIGVLFQRELTRVAMARQAHADHSHLRSWFAVAAMATDTPADLVLAELQQDLTAPVADAESASQYDFAGDNLTGTLRYHLRAGCPVPVLLRALSRLHDVSECVVEGHDRHGRLSLAVNLLPGVERTWWEEQFRSLLAACADGGLPALYPPAFSLDELLA